MSLLFAKKSCRYVFTAMQINKPLNFKKKMPESKNIHQENMPFPSKMPILPVRDRIVFPSVSAPLVVGREKSIQAIQKAFEGNKLIFITAQRHMKVEDPKQGDLYEHGTVAEILQIVNLPEGIIRVKVVGRARAHLLDMSEKEGYLVADVQPVIVPSLNNEDPLKLEAHRRLVIKKFEDYSKKTGRIHVDVVANANLITSLDQFTDFICDALLIGLEEKQDLIETASIPKRLARLVEILDSEIEILNIERKIQLRVHRQIEKNQKEYYLNEQMRAIQKELKKKDDSGQEIENFRQKIKELKLSAETEEMALKEVDRLEKMMPFSPEATVVRNYLEWIVGLPWNTLTKDQIDMRDAQKILEEDHFGLNKPKERLLEYLAVLKLTQTLKGPALCFVGPPGVGKTSLAKSLARAMGREFVRISLGGVRDESDIRGHRRTYIGSMPGRIIHSLRKVKTRNPVILLDEIDKMGSDLRGDPAAALLEVLDPEQNKNFVDHYLDAGFDLSQVIFITTANSLYGIPSTLQDRLEVIRFSAYTTDEKVSIANKFLLPKALKDHGLESSSIQFEEEALRKLIHTYTQEAGVRELSRKIAQICRKVAVEFVRNSEKNVKSAVNAIALKDLSRYLGAPDFIREKITVNSVGVVTGLAWTEHGGETLTIEVNTMPGKGKLTLTGKLGSVMQESAQAAYSLIRSRASKLGLRQNLFTKTDIHIHIPEGAVPKDGPSAGIALTVAIYSALSGKPVQKDLAMTGEVTLRGRVLPIGGLKEKVVAAFREGIKVVLFPKGNEKDLAEISEKILKQVKMYSVESIDDVFHKAIVQSPSSTKAETKSKVFPLLRD
ncbi:MAG: endopeptidase La [Elusimicrobiota bacterium]